mgnify:CR=1 FL=1
MRDNTIFDDVFRTMMEKMTFLVVPLINDVFHTSYPADVEIVQLRNEYQRVDGEIIMDSRLLIGNRIYHIECQSTDDTTMAVRMIEYDFATAVELPESRDGGIGWSFRVLVCCILETVGIRRIFWKWMWFSRWRMSFVQSACH